MPALSSFQYTCFQIQQREIIAFSASQSYTYALFSSQLEEHMSSGAFLNRTQRPGLWPWLMGGVTLLITTLFPPLGFSLNYSLIPGWVQPLVVYGSQGGIVWQLLHYAQDNAEASLPLSAWFWLILPFCIVPIVLSLSSALTWRRVVSCTSRLTVRRGLRAVVLAVALALFAIGLLDLLIIGPFALFAPNEGNVLALIIIPIVALAQSLWILPGLLIAGAILTLLQARYSTR